MKIRKIISLALCLVMMCVAFASCGERDIGEYMDHYKDFVSEPIVKLNFDLYVITECDDSKEAESAMATVEAKINQLLDDKFNSSVTIHYLNADEYIDTVYAVDNGSVGELVNNSNYNAGSIVLITGKEMYDNLMAKNALVDLRDYLDTTDFGQLKAQITPSLLDFVKVYNDDNTESLYMIPNDHVIGEYKYTVINRELAEGKYSYSAQTELLDMVIVDGQPNKIASELINDIRGDKVEDVIKVVSGNFSDRAEWEANGYICNISEYPEVTSEIAYAAGFGILNSADIMNPANEKQTLVSKAECERRAMEIVYSINADEDIRNLLQYGVENSNYVFETKKVTTLDGTEIEVKYVNPIPENKYKMNLLYTGDMFNAYPCEEPVWSVGDESGAWTYYDAISGDNQNKDSVNK